MRRLMCVPMMTLCLLLSGCGGQEETEDLRLPYREMSGCTMTATVTCEQAGAEWEALLRCDYVPEGECTVEVLEPEIIAGVKASFTDGKLRLEYGETELNAGTLSVREVSPVLCLAELMSALRDGWLLEENDEAWQEIPCRRILLDQTGAGGEKIVSAVWLKTEGGTPLRGEISVGGEIILTAEFTEFEFHDIINR